MKRERYKGEELQRRFDAAYALYQMAPPGCCMRCWTTQDVKEADIAVGDMELERQTGRLELNGIVKMRLCQRCWSLLFDMHRESGLRPRPL